MTMLALLQIVLHFIIKMFLFHHYGNIEVDGW